MIVFIKIWQEGDYLPLPIATYMDKITKIVDVETDLFEAYSNWSVTKCPVMTKILFHAPWGLAALLRGDTEKITMLEKITEWICLQWWGITQSFAMLLFAI